ncbi:hypothetical protein BJ912DRAFT_181414 [Pholiota molesta]|nr:hypothetical protein BJ912DRAFT_181414 [Pholiota molesta]
MSWLPMAPFLRAKPQSMGASTTTRMATWRIASPRTRRATTRMMRRRARWQGRMRLTTMLRMRLVARRHDDPSPSSTGDSCKIPRTLLTHPASAESCRTHIHAPSFDVGPMSALTSFSPRHQPLTTLLSPRRSHRTIYDARISLPVLGAHLNCRTDVLALSPVFEQVFEQVLGSARLRDIRLRYSTLTCMVRRMERPPSYLMPLSERFRPLWPLIIALSRRLSVSPPGAAGTKFSAIAAISQRSSVHGFSLTAMPASHTRLCSIIQYLFYPKGEFSPIFTSVLYRQPTPCVLANFWPSSLHPPHLCDAYHAIWAPCDAGSISFA